MDGTRCAACGGEREAEDRFCAACGAPLAPVGAAGSDEPVLGRDFSTRAALAGVDPSAVAVAEVCPDLLLWQPLRRAGLSTLADVEPLSERAFLRLVPEVDPAELPEIRARAVALLARRSRPGDGGPAAAAPPAAAVDADADRGGGAAGSAVVAPGAAAVAGPARGGADGDGDGNELAVLAGGLSVLRDRDRFVLDRRFGLGGEEPATLEAVGRELAVSRARVHQIEATALRRLRALRGTLAAAPQVVGPLRAEFGLGWDDDGLLAEALARHAPGRPWATRGYLRLLAAILPKPPDEGGRGIDGFEATTVAVLAQAGPLPLDELSERVLARLDPDDLERFPAFSAARRQEVLGPAVPGPDGRWVLPATRVEGINDRRMRRLNALIGELERRGPTHFADLARALDGVLPVGDRMSERNVHAWLGRYGRLFVWAGPGTYALASSGVGLGHPPEGAGEAPVPAGTRRRGIGDEIARVLVERGPMPLEAVAEHVLARFVVNRASVEAAVRQDAAGRFALGDDRIVRLRSLRERAGG